MKNTAEEPAELRPLWRLLTREDVRDHPFQVVFIVLFLFVTLVLPAIVAVVSTVRRVRATHEVTGTVVHVSSHPGKRHVTYVITYDYRFDGSPYHNKFGSKYSSYEPGMPVQLFLDPEAPHRPYRSRELVRGSFILLYLFWGAAAVLVSLRKVPSGGHLLRPRYAWTFALVFSAFGLLFLPVTILPGKWWVIPAVYPPVLALTSLWLLVRWKRLFARDPLWERKVLRARGRRALCGLVAASLTGLFFLPGLAEPTRAKPAPAAITPLGSAFALAILPSGSTTGPFTLRPFPGGPSLVFGVDPLEIVREFVLGEMRVRNEMDRPVHGLQIKFEGYEETLRPAPSGANRSPRFERLAEAPRLEFGLLPGDTNSAPIGFRLSAVRFTPETEVVVITGRILGGIQIGEWDLPGEPVEVGRFVRRGKDQILLRESIERTWLLGLDREFQVTSQLVRLSTLKVEPKAPCPDADVCFESPRGYRAVFSSKEPGQVRIIEAGKTLFVLPLPGACGSLEDIGELSSGDLVVTGRSPGSRCLVAYRLL